MADSQLNLRMRAARLYVVSGDADPETQAGVLCAAVDGGADVVQLRNKALAPGDLLPTAIRVCQYARAHGAIFIVNDHLDLAVEVGADGVHLGQHDVSVDATRARWSGLVGRSTHSFEQAVQAQAQGADYLGVGPLYETPTKPGRPAVGLELLARVASAVTIPWFAIGGIGMANLETVLDAGATRIAVVRAVAGSADPRVAAQTLRARLALAAGAPA